MDSNIVNQSDDPVKILLVDDLEDNRFVLKSQLRNENYQLLEAASGQEAIRIAQTHQLALILLDVQMPGMNGIETAEAIRKLNLPHHAPLIFLTALQWADSLIFKGYDTGAVDFIIKPVSIHILRSKVKYFVEMARQRQKLIDQAHELEASYKKLEELHLTREHLLQAIAPIHGNQLQVIRDNLRQLEPAVQGQSKEALRSARFAAEEIASVLKPLQSIHFSEQVIQSKRVLLAESHKPDQMLAHMALRNTGVELDIAESMDTARELLEQNEYDILFVNTEMIDLAAEMALTRPHMKSVFMTSDGSIDYFQLLRKYPHLSNIVAYGGHERSFAMRNIIITLSKMISQNLFGLEKYLSWGVEVKEELIRGSEQRFEMVNRLEDYLQQQGFRKSLIHRCNMVAEELLMNAIYDAPRDKDGREKYNHLPRTQPVTLEKQEQGQFRYACDGMLLAVSASDPFGALTRETVLNYLESCYKGEAGSLNHKKGGAGRGLFQIVESNDMLVINVQAGVKTEVIALFEVSPNKEKQRKVTSFQYFKIGT